MIFSFAPSGLKLLLAVLHAGAGGDELAVIDPVRVTIRRSDQQYVVSVLPGMDGRRMGDMCPRAPATATTCTEAADEQNCKPIYNQGEVIALAPIRCLQADRVPKCFVA